MNAKKCKAIRQQLRERGVDDREAKYVAVRKTPITLKPSCGRAIYLAAKRLTNPGAPPHVPRTITTSSMGVTGSKPCNARPRLWADGGLVLISHAASVRRYWKSTEVKSMQMEIDLKSTEAPNPAIAQWIKVAEEAERSGISGNAYRSAARTLEIEQETGVAVCACCFKPFGRGTLHH